MGRCTAESGLLMDGFSRRVLTDSFFNALLVFCIARRPVAEAVRSRLLFEVVPCVLMELVLFTGMEDITELLLLLLLQQLLLLLLLSLQGGVILSSAEMGLLTDGNEMRE